MAGLNFKDIASKKVEEVERPPLPPIGTYRWKITKLPEQKSVGQDDQWDVVEFSVQAQEAYDDVDLSDYKGDVTGIFNRVTFMFDTTDEAKFEQTLYRLRTFLERHVKCAEEGMSIAQALNASQGNDFAGTLGYREDKNDPETFYAEIKRTAPVE